MRKVLFRFLAYTFGLTFILVGTLFALREFPEWAQFDRIIVGLNVPTSELTLFEVLQNILLIGCAAIFVWIAARDRLRRPMALCFSSLFAVFLVRELDFFLDFYLLDNLWQVLCAVLASGAVVYAFRERQKFVQGWRRSWPSAGLALILGGIILLIPFAQIMGHEGLWQVILAGRYERLMKVIVEEMIELGAYTLITIGSLEFLYAWSRLPRTRGIAAPPKRKRV